MMARALAILAGAALLAGCAHMAQESPATGGVGSASYRSAATSDLAHYQLALGQIATGATLETHEPPSYPPSLLASCPRSIELPARVIVDPAGHVSEVRLHAATDQQPFADAVRQAVRGWRYTPLTMTRWAADADGTSHPVDSQAQPFSLDYVFTFRCEHGRATVTAGPQPTRR
jgi:hypothetical protein